VVVLHDGIAEHQKLHPDPSLRIITREAWDKKAADSPSAKAPPEAKQSKKTTKANQACQSCCPQEEIKVHFPCAKGQEESGGLQGNG